MNSATVFSALVLCMFVMGSASPVFQHGSDQCSDDHVINSGGCACFLLNRANKMTKRIRGLCRRYYSADYTSLQGQCNVFSPMRDGLDSATHRLLVSDITYCASGMRSRLESAARLVRPGNKVVSRLDLLPDNVSAGFNIGVFYAHASWSDDE